MEEFKITSEKEISAVFHSPEVSKDGWLEYYSLTISGRDMKATVRVENAPYGTNPVDFFEMVSNEWQGWKNEKEWGSMEGEFSLSAKADSTGHIELNVRAQPSFYAPYWSAEVVLVVESGQLESIARKAKHFFSPASNE
jgi:hypothetical protein